MIDASLCVNIAAIYRLCEHWIYRVEVEQPPKAWLGVSVETLTESLGPPSRTLPGARDLGPLLLYNYGVTNFSYGTRVECVVAYNVKDGLVVGWSERGERCKETKLEPRVIELKIVPNV